ncbi:MAG: pseudouridine synthase, partial [Planctomycetota bacterium]|nr:pseudouridine synthase [Planctomycetota bacterium]
MADAGVAARRMCEEMIESGRVSVNGEVIRKLPVFLDPENDTIIVEGRPLQRPERKLYLMVYKPERMLVTNADEPEFDRATIMEIVDHPAKARLFPVGRLDFETAGLVIMTNDGELANSLTHPKFNVPKTYEALIKGHIDQSLLDGVRIKIRGLRKRSAREDGHEGPVSSGPVPEFEFIRHQGDNSIVHISLLEAKNRELRDVQHGIAGKRHRQHGRERTCQTASICAGIAEEWFGQ